MDQPKEDDEMNVFDIPIFTEEFLDHNKGGILKIFEYSELILALILLLYFVTTNIPAVKVSNCECETFELIK